MCVNIKTLQFYTRQMNKRVITQAILKISQYFFHVIELKKMSLSYLYKVPKLQTLRLCLFLNQIVVSNKIDIFTNISKETH